jgi:hypothetical protein
MVFIFFALPMHERRQLIDTLMDTVVQVVDKHATIKYTEYATLIVQLTDYLLCQFVNASSILEKLVSYDVVIFDLFILYRYKRKYSRRQTRLIRGHHCRIH